MSSCAPPRATRKPEITSSRIKQRPAGVGALAQQLEEARAGRDEAHVGGQRLGDDRRELVPTGRLLHGGAQRVGVVPGHHDRGGRGARGHARARGERLGGQPRARLCEQRVEVPVVGAGELEQPLAPGGRAREPHGGHRRLGPRGGHAQHLDAVDPARDLRRELDLGGGGRAEARALRRRLGDRGEHLRMGVPVDQGPPRADVVDEAIAVDVDQLGALAAVDEDRGAADRSHRAHGRVDAAGQHLQRAAVELRRARVSERGAHGQAGRSGAQVRDAELSADAAAGYAPACSASQFLKSSVK